MQYAKSVAVVAAGLCFLSGQPSAGGEAHSLTVLLDRDTSLFLHMECLAGGYSCSSAPYVEFWRSALGTDQFDRMVNSWSSTMDRYDVSVSHRGSTVSAEYPDMGPESSFSLRWAIQQVMISGKPTEERMEMLSFLMTRDGARSLFETMAENRGPFDAWWLDHEAQWQALREDIAAMANNDARQMVRNLFGFFGLKFSALSVIILPRPDGAVSYKGFQRGDVAIIEIGTNDSPEAKIGVLLHELAHRLLYDANELNEIRYAVAKELSVPGIGVAIGLSNEVLATVIGNGVAQKYLRSAQDFSEYKKRPRSFYDDHAVDAAAKATLSLVEVALDAAALPEEKFFEQFYIDVIQSLGDRIYEPAVALQTSNFLYSDRSFESIALTARRDLSLSSVYTNHWVAEESKTYIAAMYPQISTVLLASPGEIRSMAKQLGGYSTIPPALSKPCIIVNEHGGLGFLVPIDEANAIAPFPTQFERCDENGRTTESDN